ncbi:hypothetical protein BC936DRAFT_138507 [Jimgerdemannia flammicorona]|uniref:Uncharacterized protein n=1 Tax=Jimgerdemannia flammicorona TaxID=994334 RepID=A0A433C9M2_9FUNG|nr:hypothetical protein BC936DRAFT_138507 [Jimgerdemannia flammicorona]
MCVLLQYILTQVLAIPILRFWPRMKKDDPYIAQFVTDVLKERIRSGTRRERHPQDHHQGK